MVIGNEKMLNLPANQINAMGIWMQIFKVAGKGYAQKGFFRLSFIRQQGLLVRSNTAGFTAFLYHKRGTTTLFLTGLGWLYLVPL